MPGLPEVPRSQLLKDAAHIAEVSSRDDAALRQSFAGMDQVFGHMLADSVIRLSPVWEPGNGGKTVRAISFLRPRIAAYCSDARVNPRFAPAGDLCALAADAYLNWGDRPAGLLALLDGTRRLFPLGSTGETRQATEEAYKPHFKTLSLIVADVRRKVTGGGLDIAELRVHYRLADDAAAAGRAEDKLKALALAEGA